MHRNRRRFREKLQDRINFLVFDANFDYTEPVNSLTFFGMAFVLMQPGDYLRESPRLMELAGKMPEWAWCCILLFAALYELVMCLIGGIPEVMERDPASYRPWYVARVVGFVSIIFLTAFIATLLSLSGFSWGTVLFGVSVLFNLFSCWRTGKLISANIETIKMKRIEAYTAQEPILS